MPICPSCLMEIEVGARFCGACGVPLSASARPALADSAAELGDAMIGRVLNRRYRVVRKIGQGGFGSVYEGLQLQMDRPVALKMLHPRLTAERSLVERFRREAKAACNLRDPHTIVTYDFDQTEDGALYLVMELLQGRSLLAELNRHGAMSPARALFLVDQICSSLAEAHAHGIVHRDIKPENIFIEDRESQRDFVKVLDFGIAKIMAGDREGDGKVVHLTASGQTVGTLEYMSPEQLAGSELDGRSDIYSLGIMVYQMLAGRLPFTGPPTVVITAHLHQVPPVPSKLSPQVPPRLDQIVMRCIAKEREQRFPDMMALRAELAATSDSSAVAPTIASSASVPATFVQRDTSTPDGGRGSAHGGAGAEPIGPGAAPSPAAASSAAPFPPTRRKGVPPTFVAPQGGQSRHTPSLVDSTASVPAARSRAGLWVGMIGGLVLVIGGIAAASYYYLTREDPQGKATASDGRVVLAGSGPGTAVGSGSGLGGGTGSGAAKVAWGTGAEVGSGARSPERPPDAGAPSLPPPGSLLEKLDDKERSLAALVPPAAELVAFLYPKRVFALPAVREAWNAPANAQGRLVLQQMNITADTVGEVLLLITKIPAEAWQGARAEPDAVLALRGVDGAAVRRFAERQQPAAGKKEVYRGVELLPSSDGAVVAVCKTVALAGKLAGVRAMLDALQAGSAPEEDSVLRRLVSGSEPLAFASLRLPAIPAGLRRQLELGPAAAVSEVAAGLSRFGDYWMLQAVAQTDSAGTARKLRGRLAATLEILRTNPRLRAAGVEVLARGLKSATSGGRLLVRVVLSGSNLQKLVLGLSAAAQRGSLIPRGVRRRRPLPPGYRGNQLQRQGIEP
jgi:serine/threonine protein kinase